MQNFKTELEYRYVWHKRISEASHQYQIAKNKFFEQPTEDLNEEFLYHSAWMNLIMDHCPIPELLFPTKLFDAYTQDGKHSHQISPNICLVPIDTDGNISI